MTSNQDNSDEKNISEESLSQDSELSIDDSNDDKPLLSSRVRAEIVEGECNGEDNKDVSNNCSEESELRDNDSDDEKPLSLRVRSPTDDLDEKNSSEESVSEESEVGEDDSDDDERPLFSRVCCNSVGGEPSEKIGIDAHEASEVPEDDSDDEKPLSMRVRPKTVEGESSGKTRIENQGKVASGISKKRPPSKSASRQGSVKKAKRSDTSTSEVSKKRVKAARAEHVEYPQAAKEKQWTTLVHNGLLFPPPYVPHGVKMLYDGRPVDLTPEQEEVATFYAAKLETHYVQMKTFNDNLFRDWKEILGKKHVIKELKRCDFTPIHRWMMEKKEKMKQMSSKEKASKNAKKLAEDEKYMWAIVDKVKEKVGAFRIELPGLFTGKAENPKVGRLKRRILPSDITINIGKDAPIPECPVPGERWKEVIHDNIVAWLARWDDPVKKNKTKYVYLGASSEQKTCKDQKKYETARNLKVHIERIRKSYMKDFRSKDLTKKQTAVATYLIDKLVLRAGNEKEDDEAPTVGCCTLKVENVKLTSPDTLELDFLGKDSIRYHNSFKADPLAFKAIEQLQKDKKGQDQLFDKLDTAKLNAHLKEYMPGLTAKVFRTYHASMTLDDLLTAKAPDGDVKQKLDFYKTANKKVAELCNHQRSVSKSHDTAVEKRAQKINELKNALSELQRELDEAKNEKSPAGRREVQQQKRKFEKKIAKANERIRNLEQEMKSREELKTVALTTSKANYLDPRITVSWCKRNGVPIEKVFTKTELAKFTWAMKVDPSYRFDTPL